MPTAYLYDLTDSWNNGATDFDGIRMSVTDTASGANSNLFQLRGGAAGTTSFFRVKKAGGTVISQGTLTAADRVLDLSTTWNNAGVTFTGLLLNVTDTASNTSSLLADFQTGGTTRFSFRKNGTLVALEYEVTGTQSVLSGTTLRLGTDVRLTREAANALALENGLSLQSFRVYQSLTSPANYARLAINGNQIRSEVLGTGSLAVTSDTPVLDLAQTWNNAGVTFTGIRFNVTETAAAAGSLFIDLQRGGVTQFSVRRDGRITAADLILPATGIVNISDVILLRDAGNAPAFRNAASAQSFRVYNTFTSSTNFERGVFDWQTTANVLRIGTEKGSGGGTARSMEFITDGTTRLTISAVGSIVFSSTITTSGGVANAASGSYTWTTRSAILSPSDGVIRLSNNAGTDFDRLNFGGTTNLFPALKKVGTALQVRLADDSDFGDFASRTQTITQGTITAAAPALDATATWNNAGVTFTGWRLNVTDTASAIGSLIADFQIGGVSRLRIAKDDASPNAGVIVGDRLAFALGAATAPKLRRSGNVLHLVNNSETGYSGFYCGFISIGNAIDTLLERDAAYIIAQRNAANAQIFRVYNTFTNSTNYERGVFDWQTTLNTFRVGTENAGTGLARGMDFITGGTVRFSIASNGLMTIADGIGILGGASSYFGISSRVYLDSPASGVWRMTDSSLGDFGRLCLGPATNAFPSWKRSGANVQARLGDDSGFTDVECDQIRTNNGTFLVSGAALTNGAGANTATLTNAPAAGNPTKWIPIDDNGTTRYIPVW